MLCFYFRFEDDKDISTLFEELWEKMSSGERITLQLYLEEVVSLLCDCMTSSSWPAKRKVFQNSLQILADIDHVWL
jgi:proteasome component ECM29